MIAGRRPQPVGLQNAPSPRLKPLSFTVCSGGPVFEPALIDVNRCGAPGSPRRFVRRCPKLRPPLADLGLLTWFPILNLPWVPAPAGFARGVVVPGAVDMVFDLVVLRLGCRFCI